jgi:hypothetical protein
VRRRIDGMGNKEQIQEYLKNPNRMPDPKDNLLQKLEN